MRHRVLCGIGPFPTELVHLEPKLYTFEEFRVEGLGFIPKVFQHTRIISTKLLDQQAPSICSD